MTKYNWAHWAFLFEFILILWYYQFIKTANPHIFEVSP
jgi:hypothetical protein